MFLIIHGAARCSEEGRGALLHLPALTDYVAIANNGLDATDGVHIRTTLVCKMLSDESDLGTERSGSRKMRAKHQGGSGFANGRMGGMSSEDYLQNMQRTTADVSAYGYVSSSANSNASAQCNLYTNSTGTATFKGYGDDDDAGLSALDELQGSAPEASASKNSFTEGILGAKMYQLQPEEQR